VWAPAAARVEVLLEGADAPAPVALRPEEQGYFSGLVPQAGPGTRYRFRLDGGDAVPDPASRWQPDGPHGPSEVVDHDAYLWTDADWRGVGPRGQVLYEMHIGTFTPEGTYAAAEQHLVFLKDLGITVLELMPLHEFNGPFGWGYDGVNLYAPTHLYGTPDELRHFVDAAHAVGLAVILDVVYNHFGPSGNYLSRFSPDYVSTRHENEWGEAINFDGEHSGPVREFFACNAAYWIEEFHFDGLRLDATQCRVRRQPGAHRGGTGAARARRGRLAQHLRHRRERAAACGPGASAGAGRTGSRRTVERRLPPQRDGRGDGPVRGLLQRDARHAPGADLRTEMGLPVPGPVLRLAEEAARPAGAGPAGGSIHPVPAEPRPGRQQRARLAAA
jgi:maltooligosyltrehalose trehalohydrolase